MSRARQLGFLLACCLGGGYPPIVEASSGDGKISAPQLGEGRVTISVSDIPIRDALHTLAEHSDFDLVVSDTVEGNISLHVQDMEWHRALDLILELKNLTKRVRQGVILVAPEGEFESRRQLRLESARKAEALVELESELIPIHYAIAGDIARLIGDKENGGMLTERGSISFDGRTNSVLVRDSARNISVVREMIKRLDSPIRQVQIEARIVIINEGDIEELGVRWGARTGHSDFSTGGSIEGNMDALTNPPQDGQLDDFLNVSLGASSTNASSIAFQLARLSTGTLLDLELSALQAESRAEIISSPSLLTTNKKTAYIEQGTEIPYLEAASSGAASVKFRKAVLSLRVTPQITPDNHLILDLLVTQDRPGQVIKTGISEAVTIDTQRIDTQVLVGSGETIVLGGIFQHSLLESVDKVPLLGDIPLVGRLFRRDYSNEVRRELLIFVTPRVVPQGGNDS